MSNNINGDYIVKTPPHHKSHKWLAVVIICLFWIAFIEGMAIESHKIFIYGTKDNILGSIATGPEEVSQDALHVCGPTLVVKGAEHFCVAALTNTACAYKFEKKIAGDKPITINFIKPTVTIGMANGLFSELKIFKKCLTGEMFDPNRPCEDDNDTNCKR